MRIVIKAGLLRRRCIAPNKGSAEAKVRPRREQAAAFIADAPHIAQAFTNGVWAGARVKSVDRTGNRLTISHGVIRKVGMPAMTMTFPVGDSSHLGMLHRGDGVKIHVASRGGLVQIVDFRINH